VCNFVNFFSSIFFSLFLEHLKKFNIFTHAFFEAFKPHCLFCYFSCKRETFSNHFFTILTHFCILIYKKICQILTCFLFWQTCSVVFLKTQFLKGSSAEGVGNFWIFFTIRIALFWKIFEKFCIISNDIFFAHKLDRFSWKKSFFVITPPQRVYAILLIFF